MAKTRKNLQAQKTANNANLGTAANRLQNSIDRFTDSMDRFEKMLIDVGKVADATAAKTKKAFSIDAAEQYLDLSREIADIEADIAALNNKQSARYKQIVDAAGDNKELLDETIKVVKEQSTQQKKLLESKRKELSLTEEQLEAEKERLKTEEKRYNIFSKQLNVIDTLTQKIKNIPIIGDLLGDSINPDKIKKSLYKSVTKETTGPGGVPIKEFTKFGKALGPMIMGIGAVVALFALAVNAAMKLNSQLTDISNSSGVTYDRAEMTAKALRAQHIPYDEIVKYTKQISDNFGVIGSHLSENIGLSLHRFQFNLQLSEEHTSSLLQSSYLLGSSLTTSVDKINDFEMSVVNSTKEMLDQLGVRVDEAQLQNEARNTLVDIAKINKTNLALYGKSTSTLAKSVTYMRSLGLEFDQVAKTAESVLDFESSIEKEMKTNVLLGKSINLNMVRYESLFGNAEGVAREMNKVLQAQNINLDNFNDMAPFQKKALSETLGLQADEMQLMLMKNKLGAGYVENLKKEGKLTEKALLASGKLTEEQAKQVLYAESRASVDAQIKMGMADMMDNLKTASGLLVPILQRVAKILSVDLRTPEEKALQEKLQEKRKEDVREAWRYTPAQDFIWREGSGVQAFSKGDLVMGIDQNSLSRYSASSRTASATVSNNSTKLLEENNRLMGELLKKVDQPVKVNVNGRVIDEIDSQISLRRSYNVTDQSYGTFAKK